MELRKRTAVLCLAVSLAFPAAASASAETDRVNEMLSMLPDREDLTQEDAPAVREAMEAYRDLSSADKLDIEEEGYERLVRDYEAMQEAGYLTDEQEQEEQEAERERREQGALTESPRTESGVKTFVFRISDSEPSLSVVVRYVTDTDGDGTGDIPDRIVLTAPTGKTYPLTNANSGLTDETMNIMCTWEKNFLQIDVAAAENGKWKITASDPVAFSKMPYAGIRQEITPIDEGIAEEAGTGESGPEEEKGGMSKALVMLVPAAVVTVLCARYLKGKKREKQREEAVPKPLSDEEISIQMKREYMDRTAGDPEDGELIDEEEEEAYNREKDAEAEDALIEYEEGDTDLLKQTGKAGITGKSDGNPGEGSSLFFEGGETRFL